MFFLLSQGLSQLLLFDLSWLFLFRNVDDTCTFVLLAFGQRLIRFAVFADTFQAQSLLRAPRVQVYLSFSYSRLIVWDVCAVFFDETSQAINLFFYKHTVSFAFVFELIHIETQLVDSISNSSINWVVYLNRTIID